MDERISDKSFPRLTVGALARCKPLRFNGRGEAGEGHPSRASHTLTCSAYML
jgi:hypothetical protein